MSPLGMVGPRVGRRAPDRPVRSGLLAVKIRAASHACVPDWRAFCIVRDPALYDAKASVARGSVVVDGGATPALAGYLFVSVVLLPISSWAKWLKNVSRTSTDSFRMHLRSLLRSMLCVLQDY